MKRPLLRFLLLGAALFALDRSAGERLRGGSPFPPGAAVSDDELLLHEAFARGFHESDSVVRRRLAANLAFAEGTRGRSEAELVRDALALGMHESDVVVQRRLVQKMRLAFAGVGRTPEPSESELAGYLAAHRLRWTEPARVRATQLFFATREGADAASELPERPAGSLALGDPLPFASQLPPLARDELARQLGAAFAEAVFALRAGAWSEPIASSFGWHRVYVHERSAPRESALAVVRGEVREALLAERGERAVRDALSQLRARYGLPRAPAAPR